jgi:hypothetical protein
MISHGRAHQIADEYHNGAQHPCAVYRFAKTGAIEDPEVLAASIGSPVEFVLTSKELADVAAVREYIRAAGVRGEVPGWADLWED